MKSKGRERRRREPAAARVDRYRRTCWEISPHRVQRGPYGYLGECKASGEGKRRVGEAVPLLSHTSRRFSLSLANTRSDCSENLQSFLRDFSSRYSAGCLTSRVELVNFFSTACSEASPALRYH